MKVKYDKEVDVLVINLSKNPVVESDEAKPGIIFDYDANGGIVSLEILDASKKVSSPETVEFFVPGGISIAPINT